MAAIPQIPGEEPTTRPLTAPEGGGSHPVLDFLGRVNGLLMALAVAAWALLGNEYRVKLETLERSQGETVRILGELGSSVRLLNRELEIRVQSARDEREGHERAELEIERRLRQVEQDAARASAPKT